MNLIKVNLESRSYPIYIGESLKGLGPALNAGNAKKYRKALMVTHPSLKALFGKTIIEGFKSTNVQLIIETIPEGETIKNLNTVKSLYEKCLKHQLDRSSLIIGLGGGVIGDIVGFVAATYLRGIALVHVPTTLLAMVDSSIGGKTGVDMPQAKNCIGAFHQPKLVWMDLSTLETLPEREFRNGMAEVIKYGVIADKVLFELLEKKIGSLSTLNPQLSTVITRCAKIKAEVVSKDERETLGLREILNFGHTIGHAIESVTEYRTYKHGEAVAIGMCAAGQISENLRFWGNEPKMRMESLIRQAGLPTRLKKKLPEKTILNVLFHDKKVLQGELRFVLPIQIGKVMIQKISAEEALKGLHYVQPK